MICNVFVNNNFDLHFTFSIQIAQNMYLTIYILSSVIQCGTAHSLLTFYGQIFVEGWKSRSAGTVVPDCLGSLPGGRTKYKEHYFSSAFKSTIYIYMCESTTASTGIRTHVLWIMSFLQPQYLLAKIVVNLHVNNITNFQLIYVDNC